MKVGVLGRTGMLYNAVLRLLDANHEIAFIGTSKASPESIKSENDFKLLADKLGVPFFCGLNLKEHSDMMAVSGARVCISVNWINIIGKEITELFDHGVLNAHAGDLPRYRGNATFNWAIINGEKRVCMTIHEMEPGELDSGDILLKRYRDISIKTTIGELYDWAHECVPDMFLEAVNKIEANLIAPIKQASLNIPVLRCYPRKPEDSLIDWSCDAVSIERLINASSEPFEGAFTFYRDSKIVVWKGFSTYLPEDSLYVNGQILSINRESGDVHVGAKNGVVVISEISVHGTSERVKPAQIVKSLRDRFA